MATISTSQSSRNHTMGVANPRVVVKGCSSFWSLNRDLSSAGEPAVPPEGVEGVRIKKAPAARDVKRLFYALCRLPAWEPRQPISASGQSSTPKCSQADRKSTRLNSSHLGISYAVFCLKKKKQKNPNTELRHTMLARVWHITTTTTA